MDELREKIEQDETRSLQNVADALRICEAAVRKLTPTEIDRVATAMRALYGSMP